MDDSAQPTAQRHGPLLPPPGPPIAERSGSEADLTPLVAVCCAFGLGGAVALSLPEPDGPIGAVGTIVASTPFWGAALYGLVVFVGVFREASAVRRALGEVPGRFRVLAYGWVAPVLAMAAVAPHPAFGDPGDEWYPSSPLEAVLDRPVGGVAALVLYLGLLGSAALAGVAHIEARRITSVARSGAPPAPPRTTGGD